MLEYDALDKVSVDGKHETRAVKQLVFDYLKRELTVVWNYRRFKKVSVKLFIH